MKHLFKFICSFLRADVGDEALSSATQLAMPSEVSEKWEMDGRQRKPSA